MFLDRDGTINVDSHYPHDSSNLEFVSKAIDGLKILAALPVHVIVVSNQAGIALGFFTSQQMSAFNAELRARLAGKGCRIDAFYYCPHLEAKDLAPGVSPCSCSKPAPGMLLEAEKDFGLSLSGSVIVGDKTSDIAAGQAAGCKTILVTTGKAGKEIGALSVSPDYTCADLTEAATLIEELVGAQTLPRNGA